MRIPERDKRDKERAKRNGPEEANGNYYEDTKLVHTEKGYQFSKTDFATNKKDTGGMQSDDSVTNIPKFIDLYLDSSADVTKLDNAGDGGYANYKSAKRDSISDVVDKLLPMIKSLNTDSPSTDEQYDYKTSVSDVPYGRYIKSCSTSDTNYGSKSSVLSGISVEALDDSIHVTGSGLKGISVEPPDESIHVSGSGLKAYRGAPKSPKWMSAKSPKDYDCGSDSENKWDIQYAYKRSSSTSDLHNGYKTPSVTSDAEHLTNGRLDLRNSYTKHKSCIDLTSLDSTDLEPSYGADLLKSRYSKPKSCIDLSSLDSLTNDYGYKKSSSVTDIQTYGHRESSITKDVKDPVKLIFNVVGNTERVYNDWRTASVSDAKSSMENVKDALRYRKWVLCKLADGSITGYGHGYEINKDNKQKFVDKLIVNDVPQRAMFQVVSYNEKFDDKWRMATIADAQSCMENLKEVFRYKKWVICTLADGSITGYGHLYDFIVEEKSKIADMLIVHDGDVTTNGDLSVGVSPKIVRPTIPSPRQIFTDDERSQRSPVHVAKTLPPSRTPGIKTTFDVGFILDSSGSLREDYQTEKDFLKSMAGVFGISKYGSKVGVITFSSRAEHSIKLNDHSDISSFDIAVDRIPLMGATTRIDKAFRLSQDEMFSSINGGRPGIRKILILLTDGTQTMDTDSEDPVLIADELRKSNITVLVVGIGPGVNNIELARLAGGPENTFIASSFHDLVQGEILKKLSEKSCEVGTYPSPRQPSRKLSSPRPSPKQVVHDTDKVDCPRPSTWRRDEDTNKVITYASPKQVSSREPSPRKSPGESPKQVYRETDKKTTAVSSRRSSVPSVKSIDEPAHIKVPRKMETNIKRRSSVPTVKRIYGESVKRSGTEKRRKSITSPSGEDSGVSLPYAREYEQEYTVSVYTSDVANTQYDRTIYIVLYGTKGQADFQLGEASDNNTKAFQRAQKDNFTLFTHDLGTINTIKIRPGMHSTHIWHLNKVVIRSRNKEYVFSCNAWLFHGGAEHQLPLDGKYKYTVSIFTSDTMNGGTTANLYITLHGETDNKEFKIGKGSFNHPKAFQRGQRDIFHLTSSHLGNISMVKICHDGEKVSPLWHLKKIVVNDNQNDKDYIFSCNDWLFKDQIERMLKIDGGHKVTQISQGNIQAPKVFEGERNYLVSVHTSKLKGAGTDAIVYLTLCGSIDSVELKIYGHSDNHPKAFQTGQRDTFRFSSSNLGDIDKLKIRHDGSKLNPSWHLNKVIVSDGKEMINVFKCNSWLFKTQSEHDLKIDSVHRYTISLHTSDVQNAGIDAPIYLQLCGTNDSPELKLHGPSDSNKRSFQRGQVDNFTFLSSKYLGNIKTIKVRHEGATGYSRWHLNKIIVRSGNKRKQFCFTKNNWMFVNQPEHILKVDAPYESKMSSLELERDLYGFEDLPIAKLFAEYDQESNSEMEPNYEPISIEPLLIPSTKPNDDVWAKPAPALNNTEDLHRYVVTIYTSGLPSSGTDAVVYLKLCGDHDCPELKIYGASDNNPKAFKTGQTDIFTFSSEYLGPISTIRFRHDGKKRNPEWHLDKVKVSDGNRKRNFIFTCGCWLFKDQMENLFNVDVEPFTESPRGYSKTDIHDPVPTTIVGVTPESAHKQYSVSFYTSDVKAGGTDANIYITLLGSNGSKEFKLRNSSNNQKAFQPGQRDVFMLTSKDVGIIRKVKVRHDGSRKNVRWHLNKVIVHDPYKNQNQMFPCNTWLFDSFPEHELTLNANEEVVSNSPTCSPRSSKGTNHHYTVSFNTSKTANTCIDCPIYIKLVGSHDTKEFKLHGASDNNTKAFIPGQRDVFTLSSKYLGHVNMIKLRHDGKAANPLWHLNKVMVSDGNNKQKNYIFTYQAWLFKHHLEHELRNDDASVGDNEPTSHQYDEIPDTDKSIEEPQIDITKFYPDIQSTDNHEYTVSIFTGNHMWAGTDATVYLTVIGSSATKLFKLGKQSGNNRNAFEPGQIDMFFLSSEDLGYIGMVKVYHEDTGVHACWRLSKIIITDEIAKRSYTFHCQNWIKSKSETLLHVEGISVLGIDSHIKYNSVSHHTAKFKVESPQTLVLRRGQPFRITVNCAFEYNELEHSFYFCLASGSRPRVQDKTLVNIERLSSREYESIKMNKCTWGFTVLKSEDPQKILVEIYVPSTALPAKYKLSVENDQNIIYEYDAAIYILFNPWCRDDDVYLEDENAIKEYVMKQNGIIYLGTADDPQPKKWYYGQFEQVSLEVTFKLLESTNAHGRNTAAVASRLLCSKVNSSDDEGVLIGNWTGDYSGGKPPSSWGSTPAIFEAYVKEMKSVKWGHCWVFTAILNTVLRAIGIPCRPVTSFNSAHDANASCVHEIYVGEDGHIINKMSQNWIWAFHCWNDAWMSRNDLRCGYGGWQAINATPQERSQGLMQMGPAPVKAIREGELDLLYDVDFMIAEINADVVYKQQNKSGDWEVIHVDEKIVGKRIITKKIGEEVAENITDRYKFPDNSVLQRAAVKKTMPIMNKNSFRSFRNDVKVKVLPQKPTIVVGEDVRVKVVLDNSYNKDLEVNLTLGGVVVRYDGGIKVTLRKHTEKLALTANDSVTASLVVSAVQYMPYLTDDTVIKFAATATVPSTSQVARAEELIYIIKPKLTLGRVPQELISKVTYGIAVSFTNPMDCFLTECEMVVDGTVIRDTIFIKDISDIPPKGKFKHIFKITPDFVPKAWEENYVTKKSMDVSFSCKELGGFSEKIKVTVRHDPNAATNLNNGIAFNTPASLNTTTFNTSANVNSFNMSASETIFKATETIMSTSTTEKGTSRSFSAGETITKNRQFVDTTVK